MLSHPNNACISNTLACHVRLARITKEAQMSTKRIPGRMNPQSPLHTAPVPFDTVITLVIHL